jgi:hypothetical protein
MEETSLFNTKPYLKGHMDSVYKKERNHLIAKRSHFSICSS